MKIKKKSTNLMELFVVVVFFLKILMLIMLLLEVRWLTLAQYSLRLTDDVNKEMIFIINSSVTDNNCSILCVESEHLFSVEKLI